MLELSEKQIEAIRNSELRPKLANHWEDQRYLNEPLSHLSQDDIGYLYDACIDVLTNDAPVVEEWTAEQDLGPYCVNIRGVPGAYLVTAADRDDVGVFSLLQEAQAEVASNYGEFITKSV